MQSPFKRPVCRGSIALGSACGHCERCAWEQAMIAAANAAEKPLSTDERIASIPVPESVLGARRVIDKLIALVDRGEVEALSVYVQRRDGSYQTLQSASVSRHEDAGRILELALMRLSFEQTNDFEDD